MILFPAPRHPARANGPAFVSFTPAAIEQIIARSERRFVRVKQRRAIVIGGELDYRYEPIEGAA